MSSPATRRELVRQLVSSGRFRSQAEIVGALASRGVTTTQAAVSRDLAALGVIRSARSGVPAYLLPDDVLGGPQPASPERLRRLLADLPLIVDEAPPLLVMRTAPGAAHVIASTIDLSFMPGVVGTLAGDDTIFIACRGRAELRRLRAYFESLQSGGPAEQRPRSAVP